MSKPKNLTRHSILVVAIIWLAVGAFAAFPVSDAVRAFLYFPLSDSSDPGDRNAAGTSSKERRDSADDPVRQEGTCTPVLTEGFDNVGNLPGWAIQNNSQPVSTANPPFNSWFQGQPNSFFPVWNSHMGAPDAYIQAGFNSVGLPFGTISNFLMTPPLTVKNGDQFSFYSRTNLNPTEFPDRLELRLSLNGSSTNVGMTADSVGDFTNLLLVINPFLTSNDYPAVWTQYMVTITGVPTPTMGRFAFRYYVAPNAGPIGSQADHIGIDTVTYISCPTGPMPSPTATMVPPEPTPTATMVPPEPTPTATMVPPEPTPTATMVPPEPTPTATMIPPAPSPTATMVPPVPSPSATATPPPTGCPLDRIVFYAYNLDDHSLLRFTGSQPGIIDMVIPLSGPAFTSPETAGTLTGIDFRPADGQLFGMHNNGVTDRVVIINPFTGSMTGVGLGTNASQAQRFGFDFNPTVDRIRLTNDLAGNFRFHPVTGELVATDTSLAFAMGDPNAGTAPAVVHVAYDRNFSMATMTTLFGIETNTNSLVSIGGPDGTPSPNGGEVFTIGDLGVDPTEHGGFDIQAFTNDAYAALRVGGVSILYHINLATGAATPLGEIGSQTLIDGLAVTSCASSAGVEVTGRVLTSDGRGLRNASVSITDAQGTIRTVTTSSFGNYRFDQVDVGSTFIITVSSRRYRFTPRLLQVMDNVSGVDFIGVD